MKHVSKLIADLKHIITQDNDAACVALRDIAVAQESSRAKSPSRHQPVLLHASLRRVGATDGFTLKKKHNGLSKQYLNIHGAPRRSPKREVDRKALMLSATVRVSLARQMQSMRTSVSKLVRMASETMDLR